MSSPGPRQRTWLVRGVALVVVLALLFPVAVSAVTYEPTDYRTGTVERPANGTTVVSIQGFHWQGRGSHKKPSGLVVADSQGRQDWRYNGTARGAKWYYDVDPLPNSNLLVVRTSANATTLVFELDPESGARRWAERLPIKDTHDVDLINGDQLLVAHMRGYDPGGETNNDSLFIYDRSEDRVVWNWRFAEHFPRSGGGSYDEDWTHVNDVDKIAPGRYLVSVRNFDQVIVVDRETGSIDRRLGADDQWSILHEQHNPTYLESEGGRPTILVADSENDRILEYERRDGGWVRTWELSGGMNWPRDADRLPNGNTLIVDSLNHRVIEVTPTGRIVWEVYTPWGPYDAERMAYGDEAGGPTIADLNASGSYQLSNSAGLTPGTGGQVTFAQWMERAAAGTPAAGPIGWFAARWAHIVPWIAPVWMTGWDTVYAVLAGLILVGWAAVEAAHSRSIRRWLRRVPP